MKHSLLNLKFITVLLLVLTTGTMAMAQKTATASGDWSNPATWTPAGAPTSGQTVTINNGIVLTVNVTNAECASISFNGGSSQTTINITSGNSLEVGGLIAMGSGSDGTSERTINITGGTLSCGSLTMGNPSGGDDGARVNINNLGSFTVDGNITMPGSTTENIIDINNGGSFKANGTISGGTCLPDAGSTFEYGGSVAQTINAYQYYNLKISGTGLKTLGGDRSLDGNLTVDAGATLTLGGSDLTIDVNGSRSIDINGTVNINGNGRLQESGTGTKTLTLGSTGRLNITDNGGTGMPILNAYVLDPASIVDFGSTDGQTIENSITYGNIITSGSGTKTLETSGGTMTIAGSLTIGSGTTLDGNDKTINLGGDFINNATFTQTNTRVVFNGSSVQTIGGSTTQTFNNVTVNGAGVTLARSASITGNLTLTNGLVTTTATELLSLGASSTLTGGTTNASFVNGPLAKSTASTTTFTFPIGTVSSGLRAVSITPSSASASTFTGRAFAGNPKVAYGSTRQAPLEQLSFCEYWTLDRTGAANATVTIPFNGGNCGGSSYVNDPSTLLVARHNGTQWVSEGNSGTTANTVSSNMVSSFSPFALGTSDPEANPLPVTFSQVRAFEKNSGVQVEWSNMTEKDVIDYTVERSSNGQSFTAISQLAARSNNDGRQDYSSFDASPVTGVNYYRIMVRETSGKMVYSKVLKVDLGGKLQTFTMYPNPVTGGQVTLGLTAVQGKYSVQVITANGQVIHTQTLNHTGGNMSQQVQLPGSVKPGVYNMVISGDNYRQARMFVIQ